MVVRIRFIYLLVIILISFDIQIFYYSTESYKLYARMLLLKDFE